jgi:hypothetical protein
MAMDFPPSNPEDALYHTIEFSVTGMIDVEVSPKQPLERLCVERGTCLRVQIRPYVIEAAAGPTEVADLYLDNGTLTRAVPFAFFVFREQAYDRNA